MIKLEAYVFHLIINLLLVVQMIHTLRFGIFQMIMLINSKQT